MARVIICDVIFAADRNIFLQLAGTSTVARRGHVSDFDPVFKENKNVSRYLYTYIILNKG